MYEFDIDEIKESIEDLSYEEKMEYLSDKEMDIQILIDELEGYINELKDLESEIEGERRTTLCDDIQDELQTAGYDIPWDSNGYLTVKYGDISIYTYFLYDSADCIYVTFKCNRRQLAYRSLLGTILPDFKQNVNLLMRDCTEEDMAELIVDTIGRIVAAKEEFMAIAES